jgi:hypothetical protein
MRMHNAFARPRLVGVRRLDLPRTPLGCRVWDLTVAPVPMYNGIWICGHAMLSIRLIVLIGDSCPPTALVATAVCAT